MEGGDNMTKEYANPAEWLAELNSHSIYSATILNELAQWDIDLRFAPVQTGRQVVKEIKDRGVGGHYNGKPTDENVSGFAVAEWLCRQVTGDSPGDRYYGRGTAFRANLAHLQQHYAS